MKMQMLKKIAPVGEVTMKKITIKESSLCSDTFITLFF